MKRPWDFIGSLFAGLLGHVMLRLTRGLAVVAPPLLTIGLVWYLYKVWAGMTDPLIAAAFRAIHSWRPDWAPDLSASTWVGQIGLVLILYCVGGGTLNYLLKLLLDLLYSVVVARLPIAKQIWCTTKQLADFIGDNQQGRKVVLVKFGNDVGLLALQTRDQIPVLEEQGWTSVLLPNGTGILVRRDIVSSVDVPLEEALSFIASGGVSGPEAIRLLQADGLVREMQ